MAPADRVAASSPRAYFDIPYSLTGLTAVHFATARRRRIKLSSDGPRPGEFWVCIASTWRRAPIMGMPLLLGVTDLAVAAHAMGVIGGWLDELTASEIDDAELLIFRASKGDE